MFYSFDSSIIFNLNLNQIYLFILLYVILICSFWFLNILRFLVSSPEDLNIELLMFKKCFNASRVDVQNYDYGQLTKTIYILRLLGIGLLWTFGRQPLSCSDSQQQYCSAAASKTTFCISDKTELQKCMLCHTSCLA